MDYYFPQFEFWSIFFAAREISLNEYRARLQIGGSRNLAPNLVAARFWSFFAQWPRVRCSFQAKFCATLRWHNPWPKFRRKLGHGAKTGQNRAATEFDTSRLCVPPIGRLCHFKVALGPYEISAKFRVRRKKLGQNSIIQVDRRNFCMSRGFEGGATLSYVYSI